MTLLPNAPTTSPVRQRIFVWLLAISSTLIGALLMLPMLLTWRTQGDYAVHLTYALRLMQGDATMFEAVPNVLYHVSGLLPYYAMPGLGGVADALAYGSVLHYGLLLAIAFIWLYALAPRAVWLLPLATIGLLLVAPLFFLTPENLYFGYQAPNVYHNPTMIPLRPTALLLFIAALAAFTPPPSGWWRWVRIPLAALLTLACILAKPSYLMILLPALALVTLFRLLRRQPIDWWLLLGGIVLPAVAILGYQALIFTRGSIAWEPGRTFWEWSIHYDAGADDDLLLKLLLSIAFPLVVYALYWRTAWRNLMLNLAWLSFFAGVVYGYLLVDPGEIAAGNLIWNTQIGVFVLFAASLAFWLAQWRGWRNWRKLLPFVVCGVVFGLHVLAGLHWYQLHLRTEFLELVYVWW